MPQPWEKYGQQSASPWERYGAPPSDPSRPAGLPAGMDLPGLPSAPNPITSDRGGNAIQRHFDENTQTSPNAPLLKTSLQSVVHGAASPLIHPWETVKSIGDLVSSPLGPAGQIAINTIRTVKSDYDEGGSGYAATKLAGETLGGVASGAILGPLAESSVKGVGRVGSAVRTAAIGDTDAAALRGLQIGPKSPKALSTLTSVDGARPFLQGAQNLEDLQARIGPAKEQIWQPYRDAIEAIGDHPATGPDGPTTVRDLEAQRMQLSALNRGIKSGNPEAIQLAQQKGMTAAQLLDHEKAVKSALDPHLTEAGINPQLIRKTFGNVAQVGQKVSGRSTLIEKPQPSGLGKITNIDLKHPLRAPQDIASGLRDLVAGRPILSAKPTDVAIREAFASGGPMPDFGKVTTSGAFPPPMPTRGLLGRGAIELGGQVGSPPEYNPYSYHYDTDAMRTGRLLKAPPIELGGEVEGPKGPAFRYDTTPMRLGRLLTDGSSDDMPLSSYPDIFPEQIPQATRIRPKATLKDLR